MNLFMAVNPNMINCIGGHSFTLRHSLLKVFCKYVSSDVNTKVAKDVVLFKYENPRFFRVLNTFAICQFSFWTYLSYTMATSLKNVPVPNDSSLPWWKKINFGESKYKYGMSCGCLLIGCGVMAASIGYVRRSVRYLILHKGGQRLTLITYSSFGRDQAMTVNLNEVSCEYSRHSSRVQVPLKVLGHRFNYVLDLRGQFMNGKLFDHTAGMKRMLNC